MVTIIYSTHKDKEYNDKFNDHLILTSGLQGVQILPYVNHNEYSLSELYNKGIKESKYDIVVCCHNDIKLEKDWGKKLLEDFNINPDYGIIGKAGSCYFPESGVYWERMHQSMVGQVYHHPDGQKKWLSKYSPKLPFLVPVVTVDGLFISFDKTKIKHQFDESYGKFHFYDHGFCVPNFLDGVKIGVTSSFEITHKSVGHPNQEFFESKELFLSKWREKLPIDLKPNKIHIPEIKEKPIKNIGKVAIIIPTKGKVEMLFDCVNSFYQHCNSNLFDVFIADTGSTDDEKKWIKDNIKNIGNIKLVEYDYYNFAKINNDVVKNHIDDNYEFLLFCNNDIKILNNVIYNMLNIFKTDKKVGTVGGRLHFEDSTVQHDGIILFLDNNKQLQISHKNIRNYYNYNTNSNIVVGNTGALLMIRKTTFEKCGLFNENYINCFEDVELNLNCVLMGLNNYCDSSSVAYHYESKTRNEDENNITKLMSDYKNNLFPFLIKNLDKIKHHIFNLN
jgi:GT2 family glycosyltransferase